MALSSVLMSEWECFPVWEKLIHQYRFPDHAMRMDKQMPLSLLIKNVNDRNFKSSLEYIILE